MNILTKEQSRTLTILKGIAIILVIMIHSDIRGYLGVAKYSTIDIYYETINRIIVYNAVPLFYFISGFLFFLKEESILIKWKKRLKTIVLPYIIWCFIGFLIPFFFQVILGLDNLYQGGELKHIHDFEQIDYLRAFWDLRSGNPILSTLWFLRNLIILIAVSPIIYLLSVKSKYIFPISILILYIFDPIPHPYVTWGDIFYFSIGCWLSINYKNRGLEILEKMNVPTVVVCWIISLFGSIVAYRYGWNYIIVRNVFFLIDCLFMYAVVNMLLSKYNLNFLMKVSKASFFIYLFHEPWLGYFHGVIFKYWQPGGGSIYVLSWFSCAFAVCYSYAIYKLLNKHFPRFLNFITGSR